MITEEGAPLHIAPCGFSCESLRGADSMFLVENACSGIRVLFGVTASELSTVISGTYDVCEGAVSSQIDSADDVRDRECAIRFNGACFVTGRTGVEILRVFFEELPAFVPLHRRL